MSKLIAQLERRIAMKLFDRERGRLVPRAEAQAFLMQVDKIFTHFPRPYCVNAVNIWGRSAAAEQIHGEDELHSVVFRRGKIVDANTGLARELFQVGIGDHAMVAGNSPAI